MYRRPVFIMPAAPRISNKQVGEIVLEKIVQHLKDGFLRRKEDPLSFEDLLVQVGEHKILDGVKEILLQDLIPNDSRIKAKSENKFHFVPPFKISSKDDLLKIINEKAKICEGVMEDEVLDSNPCGASLISNLESEGAIFSIQRWDDKKALYGLERRGDPILNLDERFKDLYHSVKISHLHSIDIEQYLVQNNFRPLESGKFVVPQISKQKKRIGPKAKPNNDAPKRRRRKKTNKPKEEQGQ